MAQAYQPRVWSQVGLMALGAMAAGCQSTAAGAAYAPYPAYDYSSVAPAAGPAPAPVAPVAQAPAYTPVPYQALEAANLELKERLERVEKAMLRLDRRMQLVERNELSRMGTQTSQAEVSGSEEQMAMRALNIGPGERNSADTIPVGYTSGEGGFRPVASRNETITSALQAAPSLGSSGGGYERSYPSTGTQVASRGLPSLADPAPAPSRALQPGNADVAIWTIRYEPSKVWPERDQLPSSRDVVEALRRGGNPGGNGSVTLYARGKNANAVEFRERVKALSRYLSKVSSLDSVPIAAMAAPHMDDQTIEILATH